MKIIYHQLIVPHMLHDDEGCHTTKQTLSSLLQQCYWSTMYADTNKWVQNSERCGTDKASYVEPSHLQGTLIVSNP